MRTPEEVEEELVRAEENLRQAMDLPPSSLKPIAIELARAWTLTLRQERKIFEQRGWLTKFDPDATR
jgi:hypothetical protein